jgi:ParB/RepB/Spo0J family partition protein
MEKLSIIYETTGKAREYAPLAVELYKGCSNSCEYCDVPKNEKNQFPINTGPVDNALSRLEKDAELLHAWGDNREILLCFESDPYQQPTIGEKNITSDAIKILKNNGLWFTVLTKVGMVASGDFKFMEGYGKASFGTTFNFFSDADIIENEPRTAGLSSRLKAIERARKKGIRTWLNIEPVKHPNAALEFIKKHRNIVDHWKIGKANCHPEIIAKVDWIRFREEAKELLESVGADYYMKKSLTELDALPGDIEMPKKKINQVPGEKIVKSAPAWTEGDIPTRKGNCNVLVIAPHGFYQDEDNKDDENTYQLARSLADKLDCYAVVNEVYRKPYEKIDKKTGKKVPVGTDKGNKIVDLNNINDVKTNLKKECLDRVVAFKDQIVSAYGSALIVLIHGIDDANINDKKMVAKLGSKKDLLIGIGQLGKRTGKIYENEIDRYTLGSFEVHRLIESFNNNKIKAALAPIRTQYCGWDTNNLNQLFNQEKKHKDYYDPKVKSVQLEIKKENRRDNPDEAEGTGTLLAKVFSEFVELNKPIKKVSIDDVQVKEETDKKYIFRVSDTDAEIKELADDIKINGLVHPLVLIQKKDGKYILLCGYRRFQAIKLLREQWVEAKIYQEGELSERELINISLAENIKRRNLNPIEIGVFLKAAQKRLGLSVRDLAASYGDTLGIGTSHGSVQRYIKLTEIREKGESKELISYVLDGNIQFGVAAEVFASINDEKDRDALFEQVYKRLNPTRPELKEIKRLLETMGDRIEAVLKDEHVQALINEAEKSKQKAQQFMDLLRLQTDETFVEARAHERKFDEQVLQIRKSIFGDKATEDEFTIMRPPDIEENLTKITKLLETKSQSDKFKKDIQSLMGLLVSP